MLKNPFCITNFYKNGKDDIERCLKAAGITQYEIDEEAYTFAGARLEDHYALYIEDYDEDSPDYAERAKQTRLFFTASCTLGLEVWQALLNAGIPNEEIKKRSIYLGCEKEYWPGVTVDYSAEGRKKPESE